MAINSTDPKDTGYITASIEDVIKAFQSGHKYWGVYGVKITEAKGRIEPHDPIDKNGEHTAIASELLERVRVAIRSIGFCRCLCGPPRQRSDNHEFDQWGSTFHRWHQ